MSGNTDLLGQVKNEVANERGFKSWDKMAAEYSVAGIDECMCKVALVYADRYHSARCQEHGEAFTEDDEDLDSILSYTPYLFRIDLRNKLLDYLNTRAAFWVAGKVAGMYTEAQIIEAIRLARKGNIIRGGWSKGAKDEVDYTYSDSSIINQIKGGQ